MATLELPWAAFDAPPTWYRLPSVKVAFIASLLLHALAIALLPSLRVPEPNIPPPLTVELVREPPPPIAKPEAPPPPPVVKAMPKPMTPPVRRTEPEPQREPPAVVETREPPPPQPIAVPPKPAASEPAQTVAPQRVEPPPPPPPVEAPQPPPPPQRAQPAPAPALDSNVLREYGAIVSSAVAKKKSYPRLALMRRWQGTAELKLQIAADGNIKSLNVARSSGFDVLDEQAMKMVKESVPLPNLPDALRGREFVVDIPVAFKLQD